MKYKAKDRHLRNYFGDYEYSAEELLSNFELIEKPEEIEKLSNLYAETLTHYDLVSTINELVEVVNALNKKAL